MMKIAIFSPGHQKEQERLCAYLLQACHEYVISETLDSLMKTVLEDACDLLILNVEEDELKTLVALIRRTAPAGFPVLALVNPVAQHADDLAACAKNGLSDYLAKPLRRSDVILRVDTLLHRAWPEKMEQTQLRFGSYVFDALSGHLRRDGARIDLTRKEYELALLFFRHLNQPLSRVTLLEALWHRDLAATSRTVDTHVSRVRRKLGLQEKGPFRLEQVYGYGYVLEERAPGE